MKRDVWIRNKIPFNLNTNVYRFHRRPKWVQWFLMATLVAFLRSETLDASGDAGTQFNIFVPGNNSHTSRRSIVVITNVSSDGNIINIIDDDQDGDNDESVSGITLDRGSSYILKIAEGAVNDDLGGKNDGDFLKISATTPVIVQSVTTSSWQHDWIPSADGGGRGLNFFAYSPPTSGSVSDINVFAYEDDTRVRIFEITESPQTTSGIAQVNLDDSRPIIDTTLDFGEDLVTRSNGIGLDILKPGHSYWVNASRGVTAQIGQLGALKGNNRGRDGGGYVPSVNGSSAGDLYFFSIPHEPGRTSEKELRVVCFDDNTQVSLLGADRSTPTWTLIDQSTVQSGGHVDYVGATNSLFANLDLYQLRITPAYHRCTVFEGNWLETGRVGTSDYASGVASRDGENIGTEFVTYLGPPGKQENVVNPSGESTNRSTLSDGYASHVYIYGTEDNTSFTVRDSDTLGSLIEHSALVNADEYYDFVLTKSEYESFKAIGTLPYLHVESDKPVMLMTGNFNDNWLAYFHATSPIPPSVQIEASVTNITGINERSILTLSCDPKFEQYERVEMTVHLPEGLASIDPSHTSTISFDSTGSVSGSPFTKSIEVKRTCSECAVEDVQVELVCSGEQSRGNGVSTAFTQLELPLNAGPEIDLFQVKDDPGYDDNNPNVELSWNTTAMVPGESTYVVKRSTGDPNDYDNATSIGSGACASSTCPTTLSDPYDLHYEVTRFYWLEITTSGKTLSAGPLAIATSSGASSGGNSGLESNGRLAAKLARREISRSMDIARWQEITLGRGQQTLQSTEDTHIMFNTSGASQSMLVNSSGSTAAPLFSTLLPEIGPWSSHAVEVSPNDLKVLTNASEVLSFDYRSGEKLVASALVIESTGEVYDHSKTECDRAKGSSLDDIRVLDFDRTQLMRSSSNNIREQKGEHFITFKLYLEDEHIALYQYFDRRRYPIVGQGVKVLNIQVWSAYEGGASYIAQAILDSLPNSTTFNVGELPALHLQKAHQLGATFSLSTRSTLNASQGHDISARIYTLMESGEVLLSEREVEVQGHKGGLSWTQQDALDASIELLNDRGEVLDRVWVSDGAWAQFDDSIFGGATLATTSLNQSCYAVAPDADSQDLHLSGCAAFDGTIDAFGGVARYLGGGAHSFDIGQYQAINFQLEAEQDVEVCIEGLRKSPDDSQGRTCRRIIGSPTPQMMSLSLDQLRKDEGEDMIRYANLISFVSHSPSRSSIAVDRLSFSKRFDSNTRAKLSNYNPEALELRESEVAELSSDTPSCTQQSSPAHYLSYLALLCFLMIFKRQDRGALLDEE